MDIRLERGRFFVPSDASGASRAIIVNSTMANYLWPNQDPIGKHSHVGGRGRSAGGGDVT